MPRAVHPRAARVALAGLALLAAGCASSGPREIIAVPQAAKRAESRSGVVSASHPDAAAAGLLMLQRGGTAVDAAVAAAFALAVVDPSQTGLGGYGVGAVWLARTRRADVFEGMSQTGVDPRWAEPDTAAGPDARRPRAALVPGFVAVLLQMHERHGRLPRAEVLAPAVRLARAGFTVGALNHRLIARERAKLAADPAAAALFLPGGEAPRPGDRLVQPALAALLDRIARDGAAAFYEGETPRRIAAKARALGGLLHAADFAAYRAVEQRPVCSRYGDYTVLSAPAPTAGPALAEMLNLAHLAGLHRFGDPTASPEAATRLADLIRVGLADRRRHRGHPDWASIPVRGVASADFAASRAALVGSRAADDTLGPADAWRHEGAPLPPGCAAAEPYATTVPRPGTAAASFHGGSADTASHTSHLAVIDAERNAVSLTTSVGVLFGSGVYAEGIFLNSSGNLFEGAERAPRRKPASAIVPTLLVDRVGVRLAIGAAGAAYIPGAVAQVTVRVAGLGQDPSLAIAAPRLHVSATNRTLEAEAGFALPVYAAWRSHGYAPTSRVADLQFAGVHLVLQRRDGTLVGAADPRRDGAALGY